MLSLPTISWRPCLGMLYFANQAEMTLLNLVEMASELMEEYDGVEKTSFSVPSFLRYACSNNLLSFVDDE